MVCAVEIRFEVILNSEITDIHGALSAFQMATQARRSDGNLRLLRGPLRPTLRHYLYNLLERCINSSVIVYTYPISSPFPLFP